VVASGAEQGVQDAACCTRSDQAQGLLVFPLFVLQQLHQERVKQLLSNKQSAESAGP